MEQPPREPSPEEIDEQIEALLGGLYANFAGSEAPERFGPKIMEEWYEVEMEAEISPDRLVAKIKLKAFIEKLGKLFGEK